MKSILTTAAALTFVASIASADPLEGVWQTAKDDNGNYGHIQVAPCGAALCGTLIRSFDSAGNEVASDFNGRNIISETVARGGGEYRGKVYAPDRDKTYNSRLQLSGNALSVSGCVLGVCREGGTWSRIQ